MQLNLTPFLIANLRSILSNVHPYLDPGSGSFILQLVVATLLGGLVLLRAYWSKIKAFFARRSSGSQPEDQDLDE